MVSEQTKRKESCRAGEHSNTSDRNPTDVNGADGCIAEVAEVLEGEECRSLGSFQVLA